jgi:hypothetical protein
LIIFCWGTDNTAYNCCFVPVTHNDAFAYPIYFCFKKLLIPNLQNIIQTITKL